MFCYATISKSQKTCHYHKAAILFSYVRLRLTQLKEFILFQRKTRCKSTEQQQRIHASLILLWCIGLLMIRILKLICYLVNTLCPYFHCCSCFALFYNRWQHVALFCISFAKAGYPACCWRNEISIIREKTRSGLLRWAVRRE